MLPEDPMAHHMELAQLGVISTGYDPTIDKFQFQYLIFLITRNKAILLHIIKSDRKGVGTNFFHCERALGGLPSHNGNVG